MEKGKKIRTVIEYIKLAAIALLFCSAVFMVALYVSGVQRFAANNEIPVNAMMNIRGGDGASLYSFDSQYITPEFIGYKNGDVMHGISEDNELIDDMFSAASECMVYSLGSDCECTALTAEEAYEKLDGIKSAECYVYIKFPSAIPAPLVYSLCSEKKAVSVSETASGDITYIKEAFICFEDGNDGKCPYWLFCSDGADNYCIFKRKNENLSERYFDTERIAAYDVNAALRNFAFAYQKEAVKGTLLSPLQIITEGEEIYYAVSRESGDTWESFVSSDEYLSEVMSLIGANPQKMNIYNDEDDNVYVGSCGTLKLSKDGDFYYVYDEKNSSYTVSSVLNYENYSGKYSIFEYLLATQIIADEVRGMCKGRIFGKSVLKLDSVSYKDETLCVKYGCYYNNIPVYADGKDNTVLSVKIYNGKISELSVSAMPIYATNEKNADLPLMWMLERVGETFEKDTYVVPTRGYVPDKDGIYRVKTTFATR